MTNQLYIIPTKFVNVRVEGDDSYGYRVFDDYDYEYCNSMIDAIPDDDLNVLKHAIDFGDERCREMLFHHLVANHRSVIIGDKTYTWEQVKHLFGKY